MPFTALPPTVIVDGPAPLVLAWHMLDPPCTDAAFAAALPLTGCLPGGCIWACRCMAHG